MITEKDIGKCFVFELEPEKGSIEEKLGVNYTQVYGEVVEIDNEYVKIKSLGLKGKYKTHVYELKNIRDYYNLIF